MTAIAIGAVSETSARNLCLGFVIQKEDTVQGIERRLKRRFSAARYTRGSASKYLSTLATEGLVELGENDRYRATAEGEADFYGWLRETEMPPAVRDVLQCKLEFFDIEELPEAIKTVRELEEVFSAATDIVQEQLHKEKRARRARRKRGRPPDWDLEMRIMRTKDAATFGALMGERFEAVRDELDELQAAYLEFTNEVGDG
jgi:hypothetical protein